MRYEHWKENFYGGRSVESDYVRAERFLSDQGPFCTSELDEIPLDSLDILLLKNSDTERFERLDEEELESEDPLI